MRKEPLYRKVNTRTHGVSHGACRKRYRWARNSKAERASDAPRGPMHGRARHGRDYTPLFRFLLSKVGGDWDAIHAEAVSRLDTPEPIFWLVALNEVDRKPYVRIGESTYYSGLFIDSDNRLAVVAPDLRVEHMTPRCTCCTHTFNGARFTRRTPSEG